MLLNCVMDISIQSKSISNTPSMAYQRLPFYILDSGHFFSQKDYFTERQGQDNYLMIFTTSGSGYLKYKGQEYICNPGQIFVIDCNDYHLYKTHSIETWEFYWIHFNGIGCDGYFSLINGESLQLINTSESSLMHLQFNEIHQLIFENDILKDIKLSSIMSKILTEITLCKVDIKGNKSNSQNRTAIEDSIEFIRNTFQQSISVKDISAIAHLSEYHFIRVFKRHTGISPYEYLMTYRIDQSKKLLKSTSLPINDISLSVGFNDVNNFIRDFKKLVGTTPLKFRNYWVT